MGSLLIRILKQMFARPLSPPDSRIEMLAAFKNKTIEEAFDEIYEKRIWAGDTGMLSGAGSYGEWAAKYIAVVARFIAAKDVRSISDIGCGDFNIGRQLCDLVEKYNALDVSKKIIAINESRYSNIRNVRFIHANACIDPIPRADLITVRQVLQHLTNRQIEMILRNIEKSGASFALITEHMVQPEKMRGPNIDLPSHSFGMRTILGSGVVISAPPFSRNAGQISSFPQDSTADSEILAVYLWDLRSKSP